MAQIDYPPVQQALEHIKHLSADEETRRLAFVRERALRDERSEIRAAVQRGKLEGKLEGNLDGKAELLERQLTKRFGILDETYRARLYAATREQLECWGERILDAQTLDAVFSEQ